MYLSQKWLRGSTYFKQPLPSIPQEKLPPFFPLFTPTLSPAASLASHGRQVFETFQQLLQLAEQLRSTTQSFFEKHPWIEEHLRRWQSVLKLTCAFAEASPHIRPKVSRKTSCAQTSWAKRSMRGRNRASGILGRAW
jgi:hypothetical protein